MKKIFSIIVIFTFTMCGIVAQNLLINGDFEDGDDTNLENDCYCQDFPPRSISTFHPSVLIAFYCNDKYGKTIVKPFLGVEMENTHFYYFQFGIEVPIGKVSNTFK